MKPVEKMAARVLSKNGLHPPYDLASLVSKYGNVEYHTFPINADGITIGIGGEDKPIILINNEQPDTRRKFTLAHELGHIIIPWHTGTIVSHIDGDLADFEYWQMESEANQFASELLIPQSWILKQNFESNSVEAFINRILDDTGASRDAVLIKTFKVLDFPVVCAQVDIFGEVIKVYRTKCAPSGASLIGKNAFSEKIFSTFESEEKFSLGDRDYKSWVFSDLGIIETDDRPWRDVLTQILAETNSEGLQQSINATMAMRYNRNKGKSESEICSRVIQSYDGEERFEEIVKHKLFPQYVIKRVRELEARQKFNNE